MSTRIVTQCKGFKGARYAENDNGFLELTSGTKNSGTARWYGTRYLPNVGKTDSKRFSGTFDDVLARWQEWQARGSGKASQPAADAKTHEPAKEVLPVAQPTKVYTIVFQLGHITKQCKAFFDGERALEAATIVTEILKAIEVDGTVTVDEMEVS